MNTQLCIVGTVATDPRLIETNANIPLCSFRVASTERRYDRAKGDWVDGETNWFSVSAFRGLAVHAKDSFAKGDRVIVTGRLRVRSWESGEKSGTSVDIDADALGHDVRWGVSTFRKHRSGGDAHRDDAAPTESEEQRERWDDSVPASPSIESVDDESAERMGSDGFTPALP